MRGFCMYVKIKQICKNINKMKKSEDVGLYKRLSNMETISSAARKSATKFSKRPVPDSLDLALASTYDHHAIWGAARGYVVKQENACVEEHSSIHVPTFVTTTKSYIKSNMPRTDMTVNQKGMEENCKESHSSYRNATFHVQLGMPPHHTSNSRRGYGRSLDGSFYTT